MSRFYAVVTLWLVAASVLAAPVGGAIYSWKDAEGHFHYGDKKPPHNKATTLDINASPSIKPVSTKLMEKYLQGIWLHNVDEGKETLHFKSDHRVSGALLFGGDKLLAFRGTWRMDDGWMLLDVNLFADTDKPIREDTFAITELTQYTMTQERSGATKQYWYASGRR